MFTSDLQEAGCNYCGAFQSPAQGWSGRRHGQIRRRDNQKWSVSPPDAGVLIKAEGYLDFSPRRKLPGRDVRFKTPACPGLLAGIHSGTWLTRDAWILGGECKRKSFPIQGV